MAASTRCCGKSLELGWTLLIWFRVSADGAAPRNQAEESAKGQRLRSRPVAWCSRASDGAG
jgi:hypothetical protein